MINGLRNYHQRQQNNINQMLQGYQNNQHQGFGNNAPYQQHGMGRPQNNQFFGKPHMGSNFGGSRSNANGMNRNQIIIGHLMKVKAVVEKDFRMKSIPFRDLSNLNNLNDLCLLFEINTKINNKSTMLNLRINPGFPKQAPEFSYNQILIHPDIDRAENKVKIENISPWNSSKPMGTLVQEIEQYFKISPPENSPELEELFTQIKKLENSISSFKNLDFQSFVHNMDEGQRSAFENGDYGALRESQEFKNVKSRMMELASHLNDKTNEVNELRERLENLREENQGNVEEYKESLNELNSMKSTLSNYEMRYDDENVKRFLKDKINQLNIKKEEIRDQMVECDYDDLNGLQDEFLNISTLLAKYITIHEKAFAF